MNNIGHKRERVEIPVISIKDACNKHAQIVDQTLFFNDNAYKMEKIGEGKEHFVSIFAEKKVLEIGNLRLNTEEIVLKRYHHNIKAKMLPKIMKQEIKAFRMLQQNNIPVPICYATPQNVFDPTCKKSGGFWLLQKMPTSVKIGTTDKKILKQARKFFNLNANNIHDGNGEVINDLRTPNVMLDNNGKMHVVDFSPVLTETEMARYNLNQNLNQWSNNNQRVFDYLTEEFPTKLKDSLSMTNPVMIDDDSF